MALVLANRVQETATPNTTVSFTLTGAVQGFQSFATVGNTNTTYYSATDTLGNWEVGLGTYSSAGPTLTRTTIYASSNSGSAVTFPGSVTVFVTYPSGKSVNLDATGNVSALGTVSSGTWQGSTVGVAYGGTGVTTSSGANSVMLRDANQNTAINRLNQSNTNTTAAGGTTALTAASSYSHTLVGTGNQTFTLPDATTLTTGVAFLFNNRATGTVTIQDYATATIGTITAGGAGAVFLTDNSTVGGTWEVHGYLPEGVTWGTNALNLGSTVISNGTWQGGTIQSGYGGTGLTTFTGANNALYSTSASNLVAGTLPIAAGGTGVTTTPTNGQLLIGNGTNYTVSSLGSGTGISTTTGAGTLTINNTGVTSLAGTSPVTASASTGSVTMSLASGYGDTQNPYASKTANFFLAAPNGSAGAPTFRAIVAADIPTLNQNTTGSAGSVANDVTFNNGGAGDASGTTFNGSAARTISYNTIGAPSTTGTNATGTWAINIIGNAATATSATSATNASNLTGGNISGAMTGTMAAGSQVLELANNDNYLSARVIRNNASTSNRDGMYIGYGNSNSGVTRIYGGGATSGGIEITGSGVNNVTIAGNIALNAGNYNSYAPTLTGTGASGTWGISISGNAATATTASNSNLLNNLSSTQLFNNMGQNHTTYTDANSFTNFGTQYLQGATNGPGAGGTQWYMLGMGLGNDYAYSSYAMQVAIPRTPTGGNPYISVRYREGGTWNSWAKIWAGYADSAGSAGSVAWTGISSGTRNDYALGFQPPASGYAGFYFSKSTSSATAQDAGFFLIRGTSDNFPPYSNEGITLVSDANSLNLFARGSSLVSGGNAWVRMGTGSAESFRLQGDYSVSLNSSRAPIFYDSDDTGYYVNPNGESNLFGVTSTKYLPGLSGSTYNWNGSIAQFYWTKIANLSGDGQTTLLVTTKTDNNYIPYVAAILSLSAWNSSSISIKLDTLTSNDITVLVRVDNNNDVWLYTDAVWGSYKQWTVINRYGGTTIYTSGFVETLTTPPNSTQISVGQSMRGSQGAMSSASVSNNSSNFFGNVTARAAMYSPIYYDNDNTAYYVDPNSTSNVYGINASFVNSIVLGRGGGSILSNIAVGSSALGNNTIGSGNVAIGVQSLSNNTSGYDQTAVGNLAMFYMQGDSNTATGAMAMFGGTSPASNTGTNNSAFGKEALNTLTSGSLNVAVGARAYFAYDSVNYPTTATGNVAVGPYVAAYSFYAKSGNDNVLIGNQAAYYLNSGQGNVAAGAYAGNNLNSGSDNTFIGYYAGYNSYGSNTGNVYIGRNAGYNTGNYAVYNVAIGAYALDGATTSTGYNVAVGTESLGSNTSAYYNTAVGSYSLAFNTTGVDNVALGAYAGYNNTTGGYNIAIGRNALYSGTTGYSHTVIGSFAGYNMTTGSSLTAVGESAAYNIRGTNNTAVGQAAMIGSFTPANNTGQENSSFGVASLYSITSGSRNTAIGSNNLRSVTSGTDNVALGFGAGYRTSGGTTASATTTGTFNIYIGNYTYPGSATATRELIIGYDIIGKGSNTGFISVGGSIYQGNNTTTWATTSDARIKQNFVPVTNGLEVINGLEPFEFDYILTGKHDVGFKAQQYITVLPEQVTKHAASPDEKEIVGEDEIYGIQRNLDPYFVSAIKALTEQVKALQQEIAQLKGA